MKLAIVGSRGSMPQELSRYIPDTVTEIVSGGAKGVDRCAKAHALANGFLFTEFLPDYTRYGRAAPLRRNEEIVRYADEVLVFWDGQSAGSAYVIRQCQKQGKPVRVVRV